MHVCNTYRFNEQLIQIPTTIPTPLSLQLPLTEKTMKSQPFDILNRPLFNPRSPSPPPYSPTTSPKHPSSHPYSSDNSSIHPSYLPLSSYTSPSCPAVSSPSPMSHLARAAPRHVGSGSDSLVSCMMPASGVWIVTDDLFLWCMIGLCAWDRDCAKSVSVACSWVQWLEHLFLGPGRALLLAAL